MLRFWFVLIQMFTFWDPLPAWSAMDVPWTISLEVSSFPWLLRTSIFFYNLLIVVASSTGNRSSSENQLPSIRFPSSAILLQFGRKLWLSRSNVDKEELTWGLGCSSSFDVSMFRWIRWNGKPSNSNFPPLSSNSSSSRFSMNTNNYLSFSNFWKNDLSFSFSMH